MAPFLAVGGFIGAGYFSEDKEPPMLVLKAEQACRLAAASCVLNSAGIEIKLKADRPAAAGASVQIELESSAGLDDVLISVTENDRSDQPQRMKKFDATHWGVQAQMPEKLDPDKLSLRLVLGWQGNIYFADERIE